MNEVLSTLLQAVITVAVPILTAFAVKFIQAKAAQATASTENEAAAAYITQIADAVSTAVTATSQTYVDSLKASGSFSKEEQEAALWMALKTAKASLTQSALEFIESAYGDVIAYLTAKIEAEVRVQKLTAAPTTEVTTAAATAASVAATIATTAVEQIRTEVAVQDVGAEPDASN